MSKNKKENKENKKKLTEETSEIEKSLLNLLSIISQNYLQKQKMNEDDFFQSQIIAHELRKRKEPTKTELKGKIMKILYELQRYVYYNVFVLKVIKITYISLIIN